MQALRRSLSSSPVIGPCQVLATISGKIRKNFVKILVGDAVKVTRA